MIRILLWCASVLVLIKVSLSACPSDFDEVSSGACYLASQDQMSVSDNIRWCADHNAKLFATETTAEIDDVYDYVTAKIGYTDATFSTSGVLVSMSYSWASSQRNIDTGVFTPPSTKDSTTTCVFLTIVSNTTTLSAGDCSASTNALCEISSEQSLLALDFPDNFRTSTHSGEPATLIVRNKYWRNINFIKVSAINQLILQTTLALDDEIRVSCHVGAAFIAKDATSNRVLLVNGGYSFIVGINSAAGINYAIVTFPELAPASYRLFKYTTNLDDICIQQDTGRLFAGDCIITGPTGPFVVGVSYSSYRYMIKAYTGECWQAEGVTLGSKILIADCTKPEVQVKGIWEYYKPGRYSPLVLIHVPTGLCVQYKSTTTIQLATCSGSSDIQWLWAPFTSSSIVQLKEPKTSPERCAEYISDTKVAMAACQTPPNVQQMWLFDGWGRLANIHRGMCLDVTVATTATETFEPCVWDKQQYWTSKNDEYIRLTTELALRNLIKASYCLNYQNPRVWVTNSCSKVWLRYNTLRADGYDFGCYQLDWHALPIVKGFKLSNVAERTAEICRAKYCNGTAFVAVSHEGDCLCADFIPDPMYLKVPCDNSCYTNPTAICSGSASHVNILSMPSTCQTFVDPSCKFIPKECSDLQNQQLQMSTVCYKICKGVSTESICSDNDWINAVTCPIPPYVANATLTMDSDFAGNEAVYSCGPSDYYVPDQATIRCGTDGQWTTAILDCQLIDCGVPNNTMGMALSYSDTTVGNIATYTCAPSSLYWPNSTTSQCGSDGLWTEYTLNCTVIDCGFPSNVSTMSLTTNGTSPYSIAIYTCDLDLYLFNSSFITCGLDGQWTILEDPECNVIDCGVPHNRIDANVTYTTTLVGSIANYSCTPLDLYWPNTSSISCQVGETWSTLDLTCSIIDCGVPPTIANTSMTYATTIVGESVEYACYPTSKFLENSTAISCGTDGLWPEPKLTCTAIDCGVLSNTSSTVVSYTASAPGDTAIYKCYPSDFYVDNSSVITCGQDGNWTELELTCNVIDCGVPPLLSNRNVSYTNTTVGSMSEYICSPKEMFWPNITYVMCDSAGKWTPTPENCSLINCGFPPNIQDTINTFNSTTVGEVAMYSCHPLTMFEPNMTTIICETSGVWSNSQLQCSVIDCKDPPIFMNTIVEFNSTTVGSIALYTCNPTSYYYANSSSIQCNDDGNWSSLNLICTVIDCGTPPAVENATVSYTSTSVGSQADYTCLPTRHFTATPSFSTCGTDSQWSYVNCSENHCPEAPSSPHSNVKVEIYGSLCLALYECLFGYEPIGGDDVRATLPNPISWNGSKLICQERSCPQPPNIEHASVLVSGYKYLSTAVYSCIWRHIKTGGNSSKICGSNFTWIGEDITCDEINCGPPPVVPNTTTVSTSAGLGATVVYKCVNGMLPTPDSMSVIYCNDDNAWEIPRMSCEVAECGIPVHKMNSTVEFSTTTFGSEAIHRCDPEYFAVNSAISVCQSNGNWSSVYLQCEELKCTELDAPGLLSIIPAAVVGTMRITLCRPGYVPDGISTMVVTCSAPGTWIDVPTCTELVCVLPIVVPPLFYAEPDNVTVVTSGMNVTYKCYEGYKLTFGHKLRTCLSNGDLDGIQPVCEQIYCPLFELPSDVYIEHLNTSIGGWMTFHCDSGYDLSHHDPMVCTEREAWVGTVPVCQAKYCTNPPSIPHAESSVPSLVFQSKAVYKCLDGFVFENGAATAHLTCGEFGQWIGDMPECTEISCAYPPIPSMTIIDISSIMVGGTVTYSCEDVTTMEEGSSVRHCLQNGTWDGKEVACNVAIDRCGHPPEYPNASWHMPPYSQGRWVRYKCFPGFYMSLGSAEKLCQEITKTWDNSKIVCTELAINEVEVIGENLTKLEIFFRWIGYTDSDTLPLHYSIGIASVTFTLIPLILLLLIDCPHYRDHYKNLMKRNIKSFYHYNKCRHQAAALPVPVGHTIEERST